jgi:hypothetical protein
VTAFRLLADQLEIAVIEDRHAHGEQKPGSLVLLGCAGITRHVVGNERALQERRKRLQATRLIVSFSFDLIAPQDPLSAERRMSLQGIKRGASSDHHTNTHLPETHPSHAIQIDVDMNASEIWVITNRSNQAAMRLYETTGAGSPQSDDVVFIYDLDSEMDG